LPGDAITVSARFEPISIKERGQLVRAVAAVQAFKPQAGEYVGRMQCPKCGSGLRFTIQANGISRGQCAASGCIRWCQ
jgi:hypothetical protein